MFPRAVKRIVVLDAANVVGLHAVEALLTSPAVPEHALVVALGSAHRPANEQEPYMALLDGLRGDHAKRLTVAADPRARGHGTNSTVAPLDPASDVLVYVTREYDARVLTDAAAALVKSGAASSAALPPLLFITAEDAHTAAGGSMAATFSKWRVVHIRTPYLTPATTARVRSGRCAPELGSPLENFALGIALGVTRFYGVNASQPADMIPTDVALNTGLTALTLCFEGNFPTNPKNPNHVIINLLANPETALCWGMVAEYLLDYYGRFGARIARAIPGNAVNADPTLAFNAHFPDVWNYGLSLTTPLEIYRQRVARQTKSHLARYPHSATSVRMTSALRNLDASLASAQKQTPAKRLSLDNNTYRMLLRRLAASRTTVAAYQLVNLNCVRWEAYVKGIAVRVLHFIAVELMDHSEPLKLPTPVPVWNNDIEFEGEARAPNPNLPLRRVFDDIHMFLRGGQQPNGQHTVLVPGGTQRAFVAILAQPHVQQLIRTLADEQYLSRDDVEARAMKILRQIGDTVNHTNARTLAMVMRKVFKQIYTRVSLNPGAYETLFKAFSTPRTAVVLMPSHRSYMDFIILSYLMLVMGFPLPHICAGEDFLRLGGVSDMMRGAGAFFMRRSFKGDRLYAVLFKEYVRQLVRRGECVEFFIEGTRSRTQKTMPPKLGFLKIVTDAFLEPQSEINDVLMVPISLSYERILEGNVYAEELLGIPKPKETPLNLLKSASILRSKYGSFNLNIGEPVSLAAFAADPDQVPAGYVRKNGATAGAKPPAAAGAKPPAAAGNALSRAASVVGLGGAAAPLPSSAASNASSTGSSVAGGPGGRPEKGYTPTRVLQRVAWRITHELERHLVVTPTALTAAVLLHMFDHAALRQDGVPMAAVASQVEWLRSKVLAAGGLMNHEYAAFDGPSLLNYSVKHLEPHVTLSPLSRVYVPGTSIASYMLLSMYTNQLVHLFGEVGTICVAAAALSLSPQNDAALPAPPQRPKAKAAPQSASLPPPPTVASGASNFGDDEIPGHFTKRYAVARPALYKQAEEVRRLMWHELPAFQPASPVEPQAAFEKSVAQLVTERCLQPSNGSVVGCTPNNYFAFVAQLVYPNIESYFVLHVALTVLRAAHDVPEAVLLNFAHKLALALHDKKLVQYVQCSNKETLKNALVRAYEAKTARAERTSRGATVTIDAATPNGILQRVRELNALRNRPAEPEELEATMKYALDSFNSTMKQQAKL